MQLALIRISIRMLIRRRDIMLVLVKSEKIDERIDTQEEASWKKEYRAKLCSADQAVSVIGAEKFKNGGRPA